MSNNLSGTLTLYKFDTDESTGLEKGRYKMGDAKVIEDFDTFISERMTAVYTVADVHLKWPSLEQSVKVDTGDDSSPVPLDAQPVCLAVYSVMDTRRAGSRVTTVWGGTYYYFVTGVDYVSKGTARYRLHLDVLNTFRPGLTDSKLQFHKDTLVKREHRDRYGKTLTDLGGDVYITPWRIIDRADEGFSAPTFIANRTKLDDNLGRSSYLVYKTRDDLSPDNPDNPLACYLTFDEALPISSGTGALGSVTEIPYASILGEYFLWRHLNPNFSSVTLVGTTTTGHTSFSWPSLAVAAVVMITGTRQYIAFLRDNGTAFEVISALTFELPSGSPVLRMANVNYYYKSIHSWTTTDNLETTSYKEEIGGLSYPSSYTAGAGGGPIEVGSIKDIDRYDSRNVRIIALPYCPIELTYDEGGGVYELPSGWGYDIATGTITPDELDVPMERKLPTAYSIRNLLTVKQSSSSAGFPEYVLEANATRLRDDSLGLESKLLNSNFHAIRFVYDSYSLNLYPERMEVATFAGTGADTDLAVTYKQSSHISSKLAFSLVENPNDLPNLIDNETCLVYYSPQMDFPYTMVCARNNELPIFTSDYLDYIRNGYNYDLKANQRENIASWLSFGSSVVAGGVRAATGGWQGAVGGATGAVSSLASTILGQVSREETVKESLQRSANGAVGVSGSDDLDLMEWYSANKLWVIEEEPTSTTKGYLNDLFHYFGYATNYRKVPDVTTRTNFNFLQCEPKFTGESRLAESFLGELRSLFASGVTYVHHPVTGTDYDWDFEGETANFERWVCFES